MVTITITHSRWGRHILELVKVNDVWEVHYPSGEYMGSLDSDTGGGMSHPDEKVAEFIRMYDIDLLTLDEDGYCEVEQQVMSAIRKVDPEFFLEFDAKFMKQ